MTAGRPQLDLDVRVGRILMAGTYLSVGLVAAGVVLMVVAGISPLDAAPSLEPGRIVGDIVAGRPEGYLWLGLCTIIATPAIRVAASLAAYGSRRETSMAIVSLAILAVIGASVVLAIGLAG